MKKLKLMVPIKYLFLLFLHSVSHVNSFITNANFVIYNEQKNFNDILNIQNLPCHLQSARIKTFQSTIEKINRKKEKIGNNGPSGPSGPTDIYNVYDLIAFRFVFYTKEDLLKFYHHLKLEKKIMYSKNYINEPKENGYSALHLRYQNEYPECPVKQLECQLYIINDYYNAMYGEAMYFKNYTLYY